MTAPKRAPAAALSFVLPKLPYAETALAPTISAETLREHHGGHHKKYIDETNRLGAEAGFADMALAELVRAAAGKPALQKLFNNAAQAWNHAFYWRSLSPKATKPAGKLGELVESFGGLVKLAGELEAKATAHFGSGWAWLVTKGGALSVETTHDAVTPLTDAGAVPLLTVDVWEHAYYLDHKRDRAGYLKAVIAKHLNWDFAAEVLAAGDAGKVDLGAG